MVAALAFLCAPAPAATAKAPRPKGLRVAVVTRTQADALRRHAIRVRVRVAHRARVRLFAIVRPPGAHASRVVATRVRDVRLRGRRSRVISLRLARAGLRTLRGCGRMRVTVSVAAAGSTRSGPGRPLRRSRTLRRDARRCKQGHGGPGGGGSARGQGAPIAYSTPADADRCDFLDTAVCLQPWPNDYYTTRDGSTGTGLRLNLNLLSMPRNRAGKPIDPADYNRNDGFSPGSPIVTKVPGLDTKAAFDRSHIVPQTDMGRAFAAHQPVVVINTRTGGRQLVWAELDANPKDPANVNLIIRPGSNFQENTRYVVAVRNLVDAAGRPIPPSPAFRLYRDGVATTNPTVEARRGRFESMFSTLAQAGIDRDSLYLAWDFTTASEANLSERMLAIRNDAFHRLGDHNLGDLKPDGSSPGFKVTSVQDNPNDRIARIVEGTVTVPCYLDAPNCPPGSRFLYPPGSTHGPPVIQPIPGNTYDAHFRCIIPRAAAGAPGRPALYGHGLFGSRREVEQGPNEDMAQEHNIVSCATDWIGMACADLPDPTDPGGILGGVLAGHVPATPNCDIPNVAGILTDLSNFPTLADRVQQGMVDFMYLGRAMLKGFDSNPAFQLGGHGAIDPARLFYDGNSQGGIIGGSLIAVEPDLDRGVLGVPGMNYSTLLQRSHDFGNGDPPNPTDPTAVSYAYPLYTAYPNEIERPLIFSLLQNLWDRAEADGYALHMTSDPLPDTPAHHVLMQGGLGDWQVAQVAAETEARTIGARTHEPYTDPGRSFDVLPGYGIRRITAYPFAGSAYSLFDSGPPRKEADGNHRGTNPAPASNTIPPTQPPSADQQEDPHEVVRRTLRARQQKDAFLRIGGLVIDVCGAHPCHSGTWNGP